MDEIVGRYGVGKVGPELAAIVAMVSLYRPLFAPAVHPISLAIGPGVGFGPVVQGSARDCPRINSGQFRALTDHVEAHLP